MLRIEKISPGIHKVYSFQHYLGAISRNGTKYTFLPEPFVAFDSSDLEKIWNRMKELEYDANPT